jgi:hypothetical protein
MAESIGLVERGVAEPGAVDKACQLGLGLPIGLSKGNTLKLVKKTVVRHLEQVLSVCWILLGSIRHTISSRVGRNFIRRNSRHCANLKFLPNLWPKGKRAEKRVKDSTNTLQNCKINF